MINNYQEFLTRDGELHTVLYDSKAHVYYVHNNTQSAKQKRIILEAISNTSKINKHLKDNCQMVTRSEPDIAIAYKLHEPSGLLEDSNIYNVATSNEYLDMFLSDENTEYDEDNRMVIFLRTLFDKPTERDIFYKTLAHYLETGEQLKEPFKIIDYKNRFMFLNIILDKLLGSNKAVTVNRETGLSAIHIHTISRKFDKDLRTQSLIQQITERESRGAGLTFLVYKGLTEADGLHLVKFTNLEVPPQLAMSTTDDIMEGIKYLKQFKGLDDYPVYDATEEVHTFVEVIKAIDLLENEKWEEIEKLCLEYEIPEYDALWEKGFIARPMLYALFTKMYDSNIAREIMKKFITISEHKGKPSTFRRNKSCWAGRTRGDCGGYGYYPELVTLAEAKAKKEKEEQEELQRLRRESVGDIFKRD